MSFPPTQLAGIEYREQGRVPHLLVHGPGLFGGNGPLPLHLTELFLERIRSQGDTTPWHFVDMFHHRLLTLFYRAWASAEPTVNQDRPDTDPVEGFVASLIGMGMSSLRGRDLVADPFKFHHAGRYVHQAPNPDGLKALLVGYLGLAVVVEEFQAAWMILPDDVRWYLGRLSTGALGQGLPLGRRVRDVQHRFKLSIGPMGLDDYTGMLPGRRALAALVALIRGYCGDEYSFELRLLLRAAETPRLRLDGKSRLGWTSWLLAGTATVDRADLAMVIDTTAKPGNWGNE
ncbi:type VI secretion system protein ImpH [Azospirillum sp. RU38E]|nr:type VI secretion system protein ImpH [Azospirillum sp. RU38E]SNT09411.1 type VI secretion system protein ImpH [Azospirillum sp. RU37A]